MRLTPRVRVVVAILLTWPVAFAYLYWAVYVLVQILDHFRNGVVPCDSGWRTLANGCVGFRPWLAWIELIVATMIVIALCFVVARWAIRPFREMADVVDRFGPTSIGLRLTNGANSTARDEQTRLSMSIDRVLDRLAEGYEAQRRFASNASHELRTPLATQRALIEVSLTSPLTPEQLDLVARQLLATNERNERLIDGLLTLAETERGLVSTAPVRLDRLVAATIETFTPATGEAGLRLEPHLEPTVVGGEAALLERLAANLIGNAVKYNRADGVIWVQVSMPGHLVVANTGPVVPAEAVGTLFEPFRRLSGERLEHGGGVGLGLTIVRSIVAAHHGSVRATANPDGGLRVEVQLPT